MNERLGNTLKAIDALHQQDPQQVEMNQKSVGAELLYACRMSIWLKKLVPNPSELLQIAVRAQHLCRWRIARDDFPDGRVGYLAWRRQLGTAQADLAVEAMMREGYLESECIRVRSLIQKQRIKKDAEVQTLEDCACLVFLEHHLSDFASKHQKEQVVSILRKTWKKMSERARNLALDLPLSSPMQVLIDCALEQQT